MMLVDELAYYLDLFVNNQRAADRCFLHYSILTNIFSNVCRIGLGLVQTSHLFLKF